MHGIYDLKEMLCNELEEYGKKGELNAQTLTIVDTLAHAVKNLDKIIESAEEEEYSNRSYRGSYDGGMSRRTYDDGMSRGQYDTGDSYDMSGRRGRGRNARRDSMGRYMDSGRSMRRGGYSRDDGKKDMIADLEGLKNDAPSDTIRQRIDQLIDELQNE